MIVALMAAFPILFFLLMDLIFDDTTKDMYTWEKLQYIAADPQRFGWVLMAIALTLLAAVLVYALELLRRRRYEP